MLRYLLDTNIVIDVLKRRPVEVQATFNANASRMAISSITLAELLHGAEKARARARTWPPSRISAAASMRCRTVPRPRSTTAPSAQHWKIKASPSA